MRASSPPYRRFRRQQPLREQRIGTYTEAFQHIWWGVRDPFANGHQGGRSSQDRARGQCEHDDQSVPYVAGISRVRHFGQAVQ
jgi:hypothetical protein